MSDIRLASCTAEEFQQSLECKAWHNVSRFGVSEALECVIPTPSHMVWVAFDEAYLWHMDALGHAWAEEYPAPPVDLDAREAGMLVGGEMAKVRNGDTEFGGGPGLIQRNNIDDGTLTNVEEMWAIKATNPGDPAAPKESNKVDPNRVGKPESYQETPTGWNH